MEPGEWALDQAESVEERVGGAAAEQAVLLQRFALTPPTLALSRV